MDLNWSRMPDINLFYVSINSLINKSWLCNSLDYFVMSLWLSVLYCLKPDFVVFYLSLTLCFFNSLKPAFFDIFFLHRI